MKTKEEVDACKRFMGLYHQLQLKYGFTDRELVALIGLKSSSYISDIAYGRTLPSTALLVRLKKHFPEFNAGAVFEGPVPEKITRYHLPQSKARRPELPPDGRVQQLAWKEEALAHLKASVLKRQQEIIHWLDTASEEQVKQLQQESEMLTARLQEEETKLAAYRAKLPLPTLALNYSPGIE